MKGAEVCDMPGLEGWSASVSFLRGDPCPPGCSWDGRGLTTPSMIGRRRSPRALAGNAVSRAPAQADRVKDTLEPITQETYGHHKETAHCLLGTWFQA